MRNRVSTGQVIDNSPHQTNNHNNGEQPRIPRGARLSTLNVIHLRLHTIKSNLRLTRDSIKHARKLIIRNTRRRLLLRRVIRFLGRILSILLGVLNLLRFSNTRLGVFRGGLLSRLGVFRGGLLSRLGVFLNCLRSTLLSLSLPSCLDLYCFFSFFLGFFCHNASLLLYSRIPAYWYCSVRAMA